MGTLGSLISSGRLPTICCPSASIVIPNFGGDHHLPGERSESFADECFVGERAVDLRRVEEGDAELDRIVE
jgi:hypothetical protein